MACFMTKIYLPMTILSHFLELFFPSYCLICSVPLVRGEDWVCTTCHHDLPQTTCHQGLDSLVAPKLYGRVPINYALAMYKFRKKSKVQTLLHQLKYKHRPVVARWLGRRYGNILKAVYIGKNFDLIVPVPLHTSKLRQRGYNQSDYFAQGLAEVLSIPWSNQYLKRIRATSTQTRRNRLERFVNLQQAFDIVNAAAVHDKHLLIVDDVITTGATLEACSIALLSAGCSEVSIAAIAVAE